METQVQCVMTNGLVAEAAVFQDQGPNMDQSPADTELTPPIQNGLNPTTPYQDDMPEEMDGIDGEPEQPIEIQQSIATEVPNENIFHNIKTRKRKRGCDPFNPVFNNGQDMNDDNSPPSPTCISMVTILKFHNGEFVEVPSSAPTYNNQMSLRDMRKAITASLESCLMQSPDIEAKPAQVWPMEARQVSPKQTAKEPIKKIEKQKSPFKSAVVPPSPAAVIPAEPPVKKQSTPPKPVKEKKKIRSPDKESIKFANRQKELMKLKKEMRKRMKMEGGPDNELAKSALGVWGRTVGVLCTMCGKHVQKSYGCFRRDNAPEQLVHLFTPGMNRIKICRRCLPYKKQQPDGTEGGPPKKRPNKGSNCRKSSSVMRHVVNKPVPDISHDKPASVATIDAIQRKLSSPTVVTPPHHLYQTSPIILGESGKSDAMEYIKLLAENLKTNHDNVTTIPPTPLIHYVPPLTPMSPLTTVTYSNILEPGDSQNMSQPPLLINQRLTPLQPANIFQGRPSINQDTPPWTPQPLSLNMAPSVGTTNIPFTISPSGNISTTVSRLIPPFNPAAEISSAISPLNMVLSGGTGMKISTSVSPFNLPPSQPTTNISPVISPLDIVPPSKQQTRMFSAVQINTSKKLTQLNNSYLQTIPPLNMKHQQANIYSALPTNSSNQAPLRNSNIPAAIAVSSQLQSHKAPVHIEIQHVKLVRERENKESKGGNDIRAIVLQRLLIK